MNKLLILDHANNLGLEFPLEVVNLADTYPNEDDSFYVVGDLRVEPGFEDNANYDAEAMLLQLEIATEPELSCFFSRHYPTAEQPQRIVEILYGWWSERTRAAYASHPEWFAVDA